MTKCLISWSSGKDCCLDGARPAAAAGHRARRDADHGERSRISGWRCTPCGSSCCRRRPTRCGLPLGSADSVAVSERGLRAGDGGGGARRSAKASRTSRSAICFSRTSGATARSGSPARGLTPIFPLFGARYAGTGAQDDRRRPARADHVPRTRRCSIGAFAGREFDAALLDELPPAIDPCGERGEFHTFAYARSDVHARRLPIETGDHRRARRFRLHRSHNRRAMTR